jgi:alkylation response protein AidB-like acyl-CoA dehydrogenase
MGTSTERQETGGLSVSFEIIEEHKMLEESLCRLLDAEYSSPLPSDFERQKERHRSVWCAMADLGVFAASMPEDVGGMPGGAIATMLTMQALGSRPITSPFIPTIVCAAGLLARLGTREQKDVLLQTILRGECTVALAFAESAHGENRLEVRTSARRNGQHFVLNGRKTFVVGAADSDYLLVDALLGDGADAPLGVFMVPVGATGVELNSSITIDSASASELVMRDVVVSAAMLIGGGEISRDHLEAAIDAATVALCAEAVGSIRVMLESTVEYSKTRKQFGQSIGKFQALQHRMVDMLVACEQASAIVHHASICLESDTLSRKRATSACKATVSRTARMVAQAAVQLHGAIGITNELPLTQYFRRIEVFTLRFGSADDHIGRYMELLDSVPERVDVRE